MESRNIMSGLTGRYNRLMAFRLMAICPGMTLLGAGGKQYYPAGRGAEGAFNPKSPQYGWTSSWLSGYQSFLIKQRFQSLSDNHVQPTQDHQPVPTAAAMTDRRPVIFISHSVEGDPVAKEALAAIKSKPLENLYRFVDCTPSSPECPKSAEDWKKWILKSINECDSAIVIVSEKSNNSGHVACEVNILEFLASINNENDDDFMILKVVIDNAPDGDSTGTLPCSIKNIQNLVYCGTPYFQDSIVNALNGVRKKVGGEDFFTDYIIDLVKKIGDSNSAVLSKVSDRLKIARYPGKMRHNTKVARELLGLGLGGNPSIIMDLYTALPADDRLDFIYLIGSAWVDAAEAGQLPGHANSRQTIAIKAEYVQTLRMYIFRACERGPKAAWKVELVDDRLGENFGDDVAKSIDSVLCYALGCQGKDDLIHELNSRTDCCDWSFIAMRITHESIAKDIIDINKGLPGVSIVFLVGHDNFSIDALRNVPTIGQSIDKASEEKYVKAIKNTKRQMKMKENEMARQRDKF